MIEKKMPAQNSALTPYVLLLEAGALSYHGMTNIKQDGKKS